MCKVEKMKRIKICVAILVMILSFNTSMLQVHAAHTHDESCYATVGGHSHSGSAASGGGCYTTPIYHSHTGSSSSGGGCYTIPTYHSHSGDSVSGGGCYTVPVYHTHTGSAETGEGCYTEPVYHVHEGSSSSVGGCYGGTAQTSNIYCDIKVYRVDVAYYTCGTCNGTVTHENFAIDHQNSSCPVGDQGFQTATCSCGRRVTSGGECTNSSHIIGSRTVYGLVCGMTAESIEGYEVGCGQDETTLIGYEVGCGQSNSSVTGYNIGCGKTESTIEGYSLGCGQAESAGVRTLICTIPESTPTPVPTATPTPIPTPTPEVRTTPKPTEKPEAEDTPEPTEIPETEEIPELMETIEATPTPMPTEKPTQEPEPAESQGVENLVEIEEEDTPTVAFSQVAAVAAGTSTATGGMVWVVFFWFFRKCKVVDTQTQQVVGAAYIGKRNNSYAVNVSKRLQNKCGEQITLTFDERFVKKNEEEDIYITVGNYQFKKVIREEIELDIQED